MNQTTKTRYTYADYKKLPEGAPYQLINGELVMVPAPVPFHQLISMRFVDLLLRFVSEQHAGIVLYSPIDVYFSEEETYQPDIVFISKERTTIIGEKKIEGAPDMIIEILSESTAYYDLKHKKRIYESHGVKEYWIVDPMEKSIQVFENINNEFKLYSEGIATGDVSSKLRNGFSVSVENIFSEKLTP